MDNFLEKDKERKLHILSFYSCLLYTELDQLWNRNTAVLLYNQLSDHEERKLFAHMVNRYYNS